jgi:hypothetical protein
LIDVCSQVLDKAEEFGNPGPDAFYACRYCTGWVKQEWVESHQINHAADCPVTVLRYLLIELKQVNPGG